VSIKKNEAQTTLPECAPDEGRREALRKLGKFGAYTAPAMLAMLVAEKAVAQSQ
jgi:hypothetical protein